VQQGGEPGVVEGVVLRVAPDDDGVGVLDLAHDDVGHAAAVIVGGVQVAVAQVLGAGEIVEEPGGLDDRHVRVEAQLLPGAGMGTGGGDGLGLDDRRQGEQDVAVRALPGQPQQRGQHVLAQRAGHATVDQLDHLLLQHGVRGPDGAAHDAVPDAAHVVRHEQQAPVGDQQAAPDGGGGLGGEAGEHGDPGPGVDRRGGTEEGCRHELHPTTKTIFNKPSGAGSVPAVRAAPLFIDEPESILA
jgi:hypothetical protein